MSNQMSNAMLICREHTNMFSRTQLRQCNTNNVGRIILILPEHVAGIDKSKVHCVKESKPERCFLYIMKATDELSRVWQHFLMTIVL